MISNTYAYTLKLYKYYISVRTIKVVIVRTSINITTILHDQCHIIKILLFLFASIFLFTVGMFFGYYVLIPLSVNFFNSISLDLNGVIALNYTLENYLIYLSLFSLSHLQLLL